MTWTIVLYALGFTLFVAAQARNSVQSTANSLAGFAGYVKWLKMQAVNLVTRAFFCSLFYGFIVQSVAQKLQAVGLPLHGIEIAGISGYAANALLYQIFGLLPWLRVEVQDLAPAPNSQVVPVIASNGPTPTTKGTS